MHTVYFPPKSGEYVIKSYYKLNNKTEKVISVNVDHFNMSAQAPLFACGDSATFCFDRETKSLKRIFIVTL